MRQLCLPAWVHQVTLCSLMDGKKRNMNKSQTRIPHLLGISYAFSILSLHFTHSDIQKHRYPSDFQPSTCRQDKSNRHSCAPGRHQGISLCAPERHLMGEKENLKHPSFLFLCLSLFNNDRIDLTNPPKQKSSRLRRHSSYTRPVGHETSETGESWMGYQKENSQ